MHRPRPPSRLHRRSHDRHSAARADAHQEALRCGQHVHRQRYGRRRRLRGRELKREEEEEKKRFVTDLMVAWQRLKHFLPRVFSFDLLASPLLPSPYLLIFPPCTIILSLIQP